MKEITMFVLVVMLAVTAVGCGTANGFGEDISTVGRWITRQ